MKRFFGVLILISTLGGLFVATATDIGLVAALVCWIGAAIIAALITIATKLLSD